MKHKPFWERNINPITYYRVEQWHIGELEFKKINNYKKRNCIILEEQ